MTDIKADADELKQKQWKGKEELGEKYFLFGVKGVMACVAALGVVPFLAMVVQYMDRELSAEQGYFSSAGEYVFREPLVFFVIALAVCLIMSLRFMWKGHRMRGGRDLDEIIFK